jgi:putative aminopeptidase FrvX
VGRGWHDNRQAAALEVVSAQLSQLTDPASEQAAASSSCEEGLAIAHASTVRETIREEIGVQIDATIHGTRVNWAQSVLGATIWTGMRAGDQPWTTHTCAAQLRTYCEE